MGDALPPALGRACTGRTRHPELVMLLELVKPDVLALLAAAFTLSQAGLLAVILAVCALLLVA